MATVEAEVSRIRRLEVDADALPVGSVDIGFEKLCPDAARSLNEAAATVAAFRPTMIPLCPADTDGNGEINVDDLVAVITGWGPCPVTCPADVTGDDVVGVDDLVAVVEGWGSCP